MMHEEIPFVLVTIIKYNIVKMQEIVLDVNRQFKANTICCYVCGRE
jgi:hypothetical protein